MTPPQPQYTHSPHLDAYALPLSTFAASNPQYTHFVVGGLVYSSTYDSPPTTNTTSSHLDSTKPTPPTRVLLLQRSHHDSLPGFWEGPGGLCEAHIDSSILDGAAREVREESGLHVSRFMDLIAIDEWTRVKNDEVVRAAKFTFLVEVKEAGEEEGKRWEEGVRMEPEEHEAFVWATEEEVRDGVEREKGRFRFVGDQGRTLLKGFAVYEGGKGVKM